MVSRMDTDQGGSDHRRVIDPRARILVVDDEPAVRRVAERVLGRSYDVVVAGDGEEALAVLAAGPEFALILLDSSMPRMGGPQVLRSMRERGDATPVVMCSGYGDDPGASQVEFPNLRGFLAKPYTLVMLQARVRDELEVSATLAGALDHGEGIG
jgi:two-component system cell cycle sensor histidine kinase/response regulator CckA